jgi:ABC-type transport system involved in cytochrome bd biosynthesis fused ATPase/permease subunit
MRAVDPRLLRHARAARGYLAGAVLSGLAVTGLILAQAALLAHALAAAARGTGAAALAGTLVLLFGVVAARGVAAYGGEAAALRAAAAVKSQLRRKLTGHSLRLGPAFAALAGLHTRAQTRRQWRLLAQLSGHFLDVVQGLPTLKAFGRAKAQEQVIATVTEQHRSTDGSPNRAATTSSATQAAPTSECGRTTTCRVFGGA